jgi:hypothetical protein
LLIASFASALVTVRGMRVGNEPCHLSTDSSAIQFGARR